MTSKERVSAALAHRTPDRVPVDYYAREEVTARLRARFGLKEHERVEDALDVDLRWVGPRIKHEADPLCYADPTLSVTPDGLYRDIWGVGFRANDTATGFYMDLADSPLRSIESPSASDSPSTVGSTPRGCCRMPRPTRCGA